MWGGFFCGDPNESRPREEGPTWQTTQKVADGDDSDGNLRMAWGRRRVSMLSRVSRLSYVVRSPPRRTAADHEGKGGWGEGPTGRTDFEAAWPLQLAPPHGP